MESHSWFFRSERWPTRAGAILDATTARARSSSMQLYFNLTDAAFTAPVVFTDSIAYGRSTTVYRTPSARLAATGTASNRLIQFGNPDAPPSIIGPIFLVEQEAQIGEKSLKS